MTKHFIGNAQANQFGGFTPYGNLTVLTFELIVNALGTVFGVAGKIKAGDVLVLGTLPEGFDIADAKVIVTVGAANTVAIGISGSTPDSVLPKYLFDGVATATPARKSLEAVAGDKLKEPVELILTPTADLKGPLELKVHVIGELNGPK